MRHFVSLALVLLLAGCFPWTHNRSSDDFKPYVASQRDSIPMVYGNDPWLPSSKMPAAQVREGWHRAGLIMRVYTTTLRGKWLWQNHGEAMVVRVGPEFYTLSPASQRGLADAVAQMYGVGQKGEKQGYMMVDDRTGKTVGSYTRYGLQLY